jgi:iron complex outermembrane recepter protein
MSCGVRSRCSCLIFVLVGLSAFTAAAAADLPASADTTATDTNDVGTTEVAEVLVTARKRGEERLQDVPASITAFSAATLEKMGVKDFADFAYEVPGLTFTDQGPGLKRYILRGIQSPGQEQVAVYFDEVPAPGIQSSTGDSGSQAPDLKLIDTEHIEVLKGPQGTTFGANSQTGVVRFISQKPELNDVSGFVQVGGDYMPDGNPGVDTAGVFNLPLIKGVLGLRAVAYYDNLGGYVDNVRLGLNEINWAHTTGGRLILRYQPTASTTIDATVWLQDRTTGGASGYYPFDSFHVRGTGPADDGYRDVLPSFAFFQTGNFNTADYVQTPNPDHQQIYAVNLTQGFSWASLTAATSIYKRNLGFFRDNTWAVMSLGVGPPGATSCYKSATTTQPCLRPDLFPELTNQTQNVTQKTVEVRLNSLGDGPWGWLVGGFYRERESGFESVSPIVAADTGLPFPVTGPATGFSTLPGAGIPGCQPCALARYNTRGIKESAEFGELTYKLFHKLELMVGLREFEARQSDAGYYAFQFPLFGNTLPAPVASSFKQNKLIQKYQISYKPSDDVTVYTSASEGFRLGGTNQSPFAAVPKGYGADSLWDYELGLKSSWFERRWTVNVAAFDIDWSNIQVSGRDPTGSFGFISNAGAARVTGLEFETFVHPVRGLDLSAGFEYLPERQLIQNQVNSVVVAPGRKGDKLPRIPEWTADLSAQYQHNMQALPDWSAFARADWTYHGRSATDFELTSPVYRIQHAYSITSLRVGASNEHTGYDVALYLSNAFNVHGDVFIIASTAQPTMKYTNEPRMIGFDLTKRF